MAAGSFAGHAFTTNENTQPTHSNLHGYAPRMGTQHLAAPVKASMPHALRSDSTVSAYRASAPQSRRAVCTHMTMNRLYGEHLCYVCNRVPDLRFVYSCQQDHINQIRGTGTSTEALPLVPDHGSYFEAQAEIAKSLGMSASIIKQMRAGEYCYEQIEILLAQRRRVKEVIRQAENPSARSTPTSPETPPTSSGFRPSSENIIASAGLGIATSLQQAVDENLPMSPAGTPTNTPSESASSSPVRKRPSKKAKCNFQVCHSCRPFFQDRLPMNVNAVLNNEIPAVTEVEVEQLPVKDSNIIRNIGLREPSAETNIRSRGETHRDGTYEDEQTEDSTPTSASSAWTDTSDEMTGGDAFPCPGAGRCPVHSPTEGCAYDYGFDDGHRALNHGFTADVQSHYADRSNSPHGHYDHGSEMTTDSPHGTSSTGSSISLPDALRVPLTPPTPSRGTLGFNFTEARGFSKKAGKAATICGDISDERRRSLGHYRFGMFGNDSNSSLGSEVEVQGGVALTEEAVEMRTPDIVDQDD